MTDPGPRPPRLWLRRVIAICLVFGIAGAIVVSSLNRRPPPIKLPDPNGYDDLVKAGALIHGDWPNKGDFAKAKIEEVKAFVVANKASLDLARIGLGRECVAPIENSQAGLEKHLEDLSRIRGVARLLIGEAMVREADGQTVEAVRSYRDVLALGQAMTQGGMAVDLLAMCAIQGQGIARLRTLRDKLPDEATSALLRDLDSLDRRRVSLDDVEARRVLWLQGAYSPIQLAILRLNGFGKPGTAETTAMTTAFDRIVRTSRFFQVELAIHAFHQDKKTWPRSVKDLVPDYLASVPIDPSTGQPIDYPANPAGELTDDLTTIARPGGEVTPRP
jgi:hypothetical protein